jgi:hypothetical protein
MFLRKKVKMAQGRAAHPGLTEGERCRARRLEAGHLGVVLHRRLAATGHCSESIGPTNWMTGSLKKF